MEVPKTYHFDFTEEVFEFYKIVSVVNLRKKAKFEKIYHMVILASFIIFSTIGFIRYGLDKFLMVWIAFTLILGFLFFITRGNSLLLKKYETIEYQENQKNQKIMITVESDHILLEDFENYTYNIYFEKITKIIKTSKYLNIYAKKENMIIPLRVFNSLEEYDTFIHFILEKTNNIPVIETEIS